MWRRKRVEKKKDKFEVKCGEIEHTLWKLPTLAFATTIKSQIELAYKRAQDYLGKLLQSAVQIAKYIANPERGEFLKLVEHFKSISIKDYVEKDIPDPVVVLKKFVTSYIKTKTGDDPGQVLKAHILKVSKQCSTRGPCCGKGIEFDYVLPKTVSAPQSGLYETFHKDLIYDMEPTPYVYLSLYILGGKLQFGFKSGPWSCG